jgi:MioC protein
MTDTRTVPAAQKTHDYTRRTWGHDYATMAVIDGGRRLRLSGWGHGIKVGDYLILPNGNGTTRYRVDSIDYRMDPPDMWFAEATFAPR